MKQLRDISWVPPGGWKWTHPESGRELRGSSLNVLIDNARRYLAANNFPIGSNFEQGVIDSICERVPIACKESFAPDMATMLGTFTSSVKAWIKNGAPVLNWRSMMERRDICTGSAEKHTNACPEWRGEAGFHMGRCAKCGCLAVKMFLATETCPLGKWGSVNDKTKLM